jgi:hypothetical protein
MSIVCCPVCETRWAASIRPCCPTCLVARWLASPNLLADKHHPVSVGEVHDEYRSIVTETVAENLRDFLEAAVANGAWYYNTEYEKFNHVTWLPLDHKPGSGIRAGKRHPERRLEYFVIADADRDPHVFADDREEMRRKISTGIYRPLDSCSRPECDNLAPPRSRECELHGSRRPAGAGQR